MGCAILPFPTEPSSSTQSTVFGDTRLDAIVDYVRTLGSRIARLNTKATGERLELADYHQHVAAMVWLAFVERGGDLDCLDEFPWGTTVDRLGETIPIELALGREALSALRKDLLGRQSTYGDFRLRATTRANRAMMDGVQWSSWQEACLQINNPRAHHVTSPNQSGRATKGYAVLSEYGAVLPQEQELQDKQLLELVDELRTVLNPREFKWLVERFARGVTLYEQVEEYLAEDPDYHGPCGIAFWQKCNKDEVRKVARTDEGFQRYCKTASMINVAVHRARGKAKKLLGLRWHALAQEVAA